MFGRKKQKCTSGGPEEPVFIDAGVTVLRRGEGRGLEVRQVLERKQLPRNESWGKGKLPQGQR